LRFSDSSAELAEPDELSVLVCRVSSNDEGMTDGLPVANDENATGFGWWLVAAGFSY
jgi:hypothetical protein